MGKALYPCRLVGYDGLRRTGRAISRKLNDCEPLIDEIEMVYEEVDMFTSSAVEVSVLTFRKFERPSARHPKPGGSYGKE